MWRMTSMGAIAVGVSLTGLAGWATADAHLLVSGRWDNTVVVIDLAKALAPADDGTPNAIVSRLRVTSEIDANACFPRVGGKALLDGTDQFDPRFPSGSIPLFWITTEARSEARNSINRLAASGSCDPATIAAENT
jgi:hypothetical protein